MEKFQTSLGLLVIVGFNENFTPKVGMFFTNRSNGRWEITGMGMQKNNELRPTPYSDYKSVWDLVATSIIHSNDLNIGEEITIFE